MIEHTGRLSVRDLWRHSELGLAGAVASGVVLGAFGTIGPVYGYEMGLPVEAIAIFMGLSILAAMAVQWPIGLLSDRLPRRLVIVSVSGSAAVAALRTAAFGPRSTVYLCAGVAVFYGLAECIYPLCLALTHDVVPGSTTVPASATLLLANGNEAVAGPVLGGVAIDVFGPPGLMFFLAASLGALVAVSLHSCLRERVPGVAAQSHSVGVAPLSTVTVLEIDPGQQPVEAAAKPSR